MHRLGNITVPKLEYLVYEPDLEIWLAGYSNKEALAVEFEDTGDNTFRYSWLPTNTTALWSTASSTYSRKNKS